MRRSYRRARYEQSRLIGQQTAAATARTRAIAAASTHASAFASASLPLRCFSAWRGLVSLLPAFVRRRWQRWNACAKTNATGAIARRLRHSEMGGRAAPTEDCTALQVPTWQVRWQEARAVAPPHMICRVTCVELRTARLFHSQSHIYLYFKFATTNNRQQFIAVHNIM